MLALKIVGIFAVIFKSPHTHLWASHMDIDGFCQSLLLFLFGVWNNSLGQCCHILDKLISAKI